MIDNARRKLTAKKVPLMVANRAQDVFGSDNSELSLIDSRGVTALPTADKLVQARRLIAEIAARLARVRHRPCRRHFGSVRLLRRLHTRT